MGVSSFMILSAMPSLLAPTASVVPALSYFAPLPPFSPLPPNAPLPPGSLIVTFAEAQLTDPDDSAAVSPISVATKTRVFVVVRFEDSQSGAITDVDFSFDSRTTVTVDAEYTSCVSFDANQAELQVLSGATYPTQQCTMASVTATVSAYGLSGSATVPLVSFRNDVCCVDLRFSSCVLC